MKRQKNFLLFFILFLILVTLFIYYSAKSYSIIMFNNISNSFVRFHVVANSNSTNDQIIKYKLRDRIMGYLSPLLKNVHTKEEALKIINNNLTELNNISQNLVTEENINYSVNISIGKSYFPTKDYESFVLPEGIYDALIVELGEAQGQNWWCVMFPSVCIPQSDNMNLVNNSMSILEDSLDLEEFSIVSKNSSSADIKIKFKLIELFENLWIFL